MFSKVCVFVLAALALSLPLVADSNQYELLAATVRPVQYIVPLPDHEEAFRNQCTAFQVNADKQLWVSASHCWYDDNGNRHDGETFINEHKTQVVYADLDRDLVGVKIVDEFKVEKTLKIADKAPIPGERLQTLGYSLGVASPWFFTGYLVANEASFSGWFGSFVALESIGGQSGSPVVNGDGKLVGVLHIGFGEGFNGLSSPITGYTHFDYLKEFMEKLQ